MTSPLKPRNRNSIDPSSSSSSSSPSSSPPSPSPSPSPSPPSASFSLPSSTSSVPRQNTKTTGESHPAGGIKHGGPIETLRILLLATYFFGCSFSIFVTQLIGAPLYWIHRDLYNAYMALTKQSFGLLITTMTQWWAPTLVRISGDADVSKQMRRTADGRVECSFPERMVLFANHQLYSDWLYLWWAAYTNRVHGHIYIILKEKLKYLPVLGPGMMFYGFIFLSRKMAADKPRLMHRIQKLNARRGGAAGRKALDPMWLLIFPEGTNLSDNTRGISDAWAQKQGFPMCQHLLQPRSAGTFFCLNGLKETVDWVYDCTMAYEGVPRGQYGQDLFTLRSTFLQGRPPKSVNMYWRRFAMSSIPLDDAEKFDAWMRARWREKDELLERYVATGRFPAHALADATAGGFIETKVRPKHWWEVFQIFSVLGIVALGAWWGARAWDGMMGRGSGVAG